MPRLRHETKSEENEDRSQSKVILAGCKIFSDWLSQQTRRSFETNFALMQHINIH